MKKKTSTRLTPTGRSAGDNFFGVVYEGECPVKVPTVEQMREKYRADKAEAEKKRATA